MTKYSDSDSETNDEIDRGFGIGLDEPSAYTEWTPASWYAASPRPMEVLNDGRHPDAVLFKLFVLAPFYQERTSDEGIPPHITVMYWTDRGQSSKLNGMHARAMIDVMRRFNNKRCLLVRWGGKNPLSRGLLDPGGELTKFRRELVNAANTADRDNGGPGSLSFWSTDGGEEAIAHCTAGFLTPPKPVAELLDSHPDANLRSEWAEEQARKGKTGWVLRIDPEIRTEMAPLRQNEAIFQALLWAKGYTPGIIAKANEPLVVKRADGQWARVDKKIPGIGKTTIKLIDHALKRINEGRPLYMKPQYG